jgi:hypothetical protein
MDIGGNFASSLEHVAPSFEAYCDVAVERSRGDGFDIASFQAYVAKGRPNRVLASEHDKGHRVMTGMTIANPGAISRMRVFRGLPVGLFHQRRLELRIASPATAGFHHQSSAPGAAQPERYPDHPPRSRESLTFGVFWIIPLPPGSGSGVSGD